MTALSDLTSVSARCERIYHQRTVTEAAYVLPADEEEGKRLYDQHRLFESLYYGGRLLPDYIQLGPDAKVLDAGTGNGAWMLDLASSVPPSASFIGFDISTHLFPASPPSNITFLEHSTISPLLPEWKNAFDLVHQRLMVFAFRPSEWVTAITNFYDALKPGGHVLLMECGRSERGPKGSPSATVWDTVDEVVALRGFRFGECADDMPRVLKAAGFVDIQVFEHRFNYARDAEHRRNASRVLKALSDKVPTVDGLSWKGTAAEFDAVIDEAEREYERSSEMGLSYGCSYKWFTAQKPSQS